MITQADLDALARAQFESAKWDPGMRAPCGACRCGGHDRCQRWDILVVPTFPLIPLTAVSHRVVDVRIETREELHVCGCDCPTAREIQSLKSPAHTVTISTAGDPDASDWRPFAPGTRYGDAINAIKARAALGSMRERYVGDQAEIDREAVTKPPSVPLDEAGRPDLSTSFRAYGRPDQGRGSEPPTWQTKWRARRQHFGGDLEKLERWEAEQRAFRAAVAAAYDVDPAFFD